MADVLSLLQDYLMRVGGNRRQLTTPEEMEQGGAPAAGGEWAAPPGFWDAIMKPPTDLPLPPGRPLDLAGGDRLYSPPLQLGQNALGIYGRAAVPMGNQDTVVRPGGMPGGRMPGQPVISRAPSGGIDPDAAAAVLRVLMPQLASPLNQMMQRAPGMGFY